MRPISQRQGNNDWKAIEVKQTDSILLVIAVFAWVSSCEEVGKKEEDFFCWAVYFLGPLSFFLSFVHMVAFDTLSGSLVGDMNRLHFLVHLLPWKNNIS